MDEEEEEEEEGTGRMPRFLNRNYSQQNCVPRPERNPCSKCVFYEHGTRAVNVTVYLDRNMMTGRAESSGNERLDERRMRPHLDRERKSLPLLSGIALIRLGVKLVRGN